jgi:hypothetical protein
MTQVELFELVRSADQQIELAIIQIISITFSAIVATYYFLYRSGRAMRIFTFLLYTIGFLSFFGLALREVNVKALAVQALAALPANELALPISGYLALGRSWLAIATNVAVNGMLLAQLVGVFWLLFFWKKPEDTAGRSPRTTPTDDAAEPASATP